MSAAGIQTRKSIGQLLLIAVLIGIGYACICTLRLTVDALNFFFVCAFYLIPFLAIRPVRYLPPRPRLFGWILLTPLLLLSSFLLLGLVACEGPSWSSVRVEPLKTFQQGKSTIQLQRYEDGGAIGLRGLYLEQRRLIVPGLFLVRSVDFFDYAHDGTLSLEGPYKVRVHAKGSYDNDDREIDRAYSLKPWLYF